MFFCFTCGFTCFAKSETFGDLRKLDAEVRRLACHGRKHVTKAEDKLSLFSYVGMDYM